MRNSVTIQTFHVYFSQFILLPKDIFFLTILSPGKSKKKKKRKKEKEKKKKRFSKFSFSLPKSYLQVMRCMARHVLQPNTMSPHHAAHFCRDYLPLFWIFISFLPSSIILSPFLLSQIGRAHV